MNTTVQNRIVSIDILRGLVMIVMALDHTRDFFYSTAMTADPMDPATTNNALYFTRWITHFCAPTFLLLSGLSAYLSSYKKDRTESSNFLLKRGVWLIIVEITLVTFGLTFNPGYNFIILQVIWAIGWSMVILGLLMRVSNYLILITGLFLFLGHNVVDYIQLPANGPVNVITTVLLTSRGTVFPVDPNHMVGAFYAILPWTGIMLLGYAMGPLFLPDYSFEKRRKLLFVAGFALILLFIILRVTNLYGDPGTFKPGSATLFSFLDTSKYPPSLQYCCMTLGPSLLLLAFFERFRPFWTKPIEVYGRVPFFYYILHFYILHIMLVIVFFASGHAAKDIYDTQSFIGFRPATFGYSLVIVYLIWTFVVAVLYLPCRWFNQYKATHQNWWLKYL